MLFHRTLSDIFSRVLILYMDCLVHHFTFYSYYHHHCVVTLPLLGNLRIFAQVILISCPLLKFMAQCYEYVSSFLICISWLGYLHNIQTEVPAFFAFFLYVITRFACFIVDIPLCNATECTCSWKIPMYVLIPARMSNQSRFTNEFRYSSPNKIRKKSFPRYQPMQHTIPSITEQ